MCEFNLQLKSWNSNASNWSFAKRPSSLRCALAPAVRNGDWCDETIATEMADCERKSHKSSFLTLSLLTHLQAKDMEKIPCRAHLKTANKRTQCSQHAVLLKTPPCFLPSSHLQHCTLLQEQHRICPYDQLCCTTINGTHHMILLMEFN